MSYTDHPVQRLKSNAPNESVQWTHISTSAIQIWWHTPPFHYKHQDGGEKIWKKCDYIRAPNTCFNHRHKSYTKIHAQSCQPDTERHSASCHVCWDAVICTYFVVIECFDWNKFVWIKVLFLENHNSSYLLYLNRTGMHFGDTWNKCPTLCVFCVFTSFPSCLMCLQITGRMYWFRCVV